MKAFNLEEVQADIEAINNPVVEAQPMAIEPEKETEPKPKMRQSQSQSQPLNALHWCGKASQSSVGVIKTIKVVA